MSRATSLTVIAIGAIFAFAVTASPGFLNLQVVGLILMATGAAGLLIERRSRDWLRRTIIVRGAPPGQGPTRPPAQGPIRPPGRGPTRPPAGELAEPPAQRPTEPASGDRPTEPIGETIEREPIERETIEEYIEQ